jgi:hypothetical protein
MHPKVLLILSLLAGAIFSLPAIVAAKGGTSNGTDKAYSLVMDEQATYSDELVPPVLPRSVVAPVKVVATLMNMAPPSTSASNVGSFSLRITNPGVTIFAPPGDAGHQPTGSTNGVVNGTAVRVSDTQINVTGMSPLKAQQKYDLTFWVTSCGDALWDADVRTGSSLSGDTFTRVGDTFDSSHLATNLQTLISCGTLACGQSTKIVADEASNSPALVVARGPFNSDGACSASSDFFASNKLPTDNNQVHFRWPVGNSDQKLAVWTYSVVSSNALVPKLAWLNNDGTKASSAFPDPTIQPPPAPAYLDGNILQCQSGVLPQPYGVVSTSANQNTLTIKVNTSPQNAVLPTPTSFPFDIVIGTERMSVTGIQGSTWTVDGNPTRAKGGTSPSSHPAGAKVMSTPLPLLPTTTPFQATLADGVTPVTFPPNKGYLPGNQAQMCIVGAPTPVPPANPSDPPTGEWSTTIIDIGDGWIKIQ